MAESRELMLLLESGGFTLPPDSLINMALSSPPKVVKFGDTSYNWNIVSVDASVRPAPVYFHMLREDPLALVMVRQGENVNYILPFFTRVWNIYRAKRLDIVYDHGTGSFLGTLTLADPQVALKVDVVSPWNVKPESIPVLSMVTAEVDVIPPVNKELEDLFKDAEKKGQASQMFAELVKSHRAEEFVDRYIEYTGWRNQYVFIGHIERLHTDTNPFTGEKYHHVSVDVGILKLDMMVSPRWNVKEGDRVKGIGLLELWLEG